MRPAAQTSGGLCRSLDSARAAMCARPGERRSAAAAPGDRERRYGCDAARARRGDKFGQRVGRWIVDAYGRPTSRRNTVHNDHPTRGRITVHNDHPTGRRNAARNDHPTGRRSTVDNHFTASRFDHDHHHVDDDGQPVVWRFVGKRAGGWVGGGGGQSVVWSRSGDWVAGGSRPGGWVICGQRRVQ